MGRARCAASGTVVRPARFDFREGRRARETHRDVRAHTLLLRMCCCQARSSRGTGRRVAWKSLPTAGARSVGRSSHCPHLFSLARPSWVACIGWGRMATPLATPSRHVMSDFLEVCSAEAATTVGAAGNSNSYDFSDDERPTSLYARKTCRP